MLEMIISVTSCILSRSFQSVSNNCNRNKSVLVLCPKKLSENWNTYKDNYVNNPIAADRLNYDVLFHTDLSRSGGTSNGLDLDRLNWPAEKSRQWAFLCPTPH